MESIYNKYSEEELALCGEPFINEHRIKPLIHTKNAYL